ncbi:hypothetical protein GGI35DRAFT_459974 [Trichoderma velutinum]
MNAANEVNSAMLNVPGYADDTMLFMMRWGSKAQATLRKVDYDEFLVRMSALNTHWFASQSHCQSTSGSPVSVGTRGSGQGDGGPKAAAAAATVAAAQAAAAAGEAEAASCDDDRDGGGVHRDDDAAGPLQAGDKAAELKARTLELIQDFPHLVRDFDKFIDCTRIMATKYGRAPA